MSSNLDDVDMPAKDVNDFRFHRLERDTQYIPGQFHSREAKVPVKAIIIASFMFLVGSALIVVGALLFAGVINAKYSDRMWPVFILGAMLFIPGFYHVRIAYYAWTKTDGFSFEDIPNDDDD